VIGVQADLNSSHHFKATIYLHSVQIIETSHSFRDTCFFNGTIILMTAFTKAYNQCHQAVLSLSITRKDFEKQFDSGCCIAGLGQETLCNKLHCLISFDETIASYTTVSSS